MTARPAATPEALRAGLWRRLAAAAYDGLLLLATLMIATAILQIFTGGEAILRAHVGAAWEYAYRAALAGLVCAYFWVAWVRRGQTLGMKSWQLRVERDDGAQLRTRDVLRRLACGAPLHLLAIAGTLLCMTRKAGPWVALGLCAPLLASYAALASGGGTLHDRLSRTRIVRVPRAPQPG